MKEEILKTSLQQFLKHGIRKMTIQELIAPMGISTKTVYKYYSNKESLLEKCLVQHYSDLYTAFGEMKSQIEDPLILIFQVFIRSVQADFGVNVVFYQDLNYYYPDLQDKIIKKNSDKYSQVMIAAMNEGIAKGYFRKEVSVPVMFKTIMLLYRSFARSNEFHHLKLSPFDIAENTIGVYLRGICTSKGLSVIEKNPSLTSFTNKQ